MNIVVSQCCRAVAGLQRTVAVFQKDLPEQHADGRLADDL
jgi:hypothetical protein